MSDYILAIPEDVYQRARELAEKNSQAVDIVLLQQLRLLTDIVPILSSDEEAELQALRYLSDDALWAIAREQMAHDSQMQMQVLMDKNTTGTLSDNERHELEQLVERGQRLMLRKSEAAAILTKRGYKVSPSDMANRE